MIGWRRHLGRDTRPIAQFIRYGIVGASATILDLLIFTLLCLWVLPAVDHELGDEVRARRSTINNTAAFLIATIYTYLINSRFIFVPGRHPRLVEFSLFVAASMVSLALGLVIIHYLITYHSTPTFAAKLASVAAGVMINYGCRRFFVFKT